MILDLHMIKQYNLAEFFPGDMITLRDDISTFPFVTYLPDEDHQSLNDIYNFSCHLDESFGGFIKSNMMIMITRIFYEREVPLIYECLSMGEIIFLLYTDGLCPNVCFVKCN